MDPTSNNGKNFWSGPVGSTLGKVQQFTQPIYDAYQKVFPSAPVAKAFESVRTGKPFTYTPTEMDALVENLAMMGGMKNVSKEVYNNPMAKEIGRLAQEVARSHGLSIDGTHDVYRLAQKALGLSEKQVYKYPATDLLNDMVTNLSKNQDFAFRELPLRSIK